MHKGCAAVRWSRWWFNDSIHNHARRLPVCLRSVNVLLAHRRRAHACRLFTPRAALYPGNQCVCTPFKENHRFTESCGGVKKTAASTRLRHYHFMLPVRELGLLKIHEKSSKIALASNNYIAVPKEMEKQRVSEVSEIESQRLRRLRYLESQHPVADRHRQ